LLSGVTVGYVSDVRLNPNGLIDVDMNIQKKYKVPRTAVAEVYPVGIFGDVAVALKPIAPSTDSFKPGDDVPSRPATGGLDALQARADTITASLGRVTHALETELVQTGGLHDIRLAIASTNRLVGQLQTIVTEQNRNFTETLASFRSTAKAVDSAQVASTLKTFRETAANADSLMLRLSSNTTQLQALLARLERGEGTTGKLLTDTLLYRDARNLLMRVDSLVSDFQKNPRKYINLRVF
jgi:phospholipid/cholesterol/gamma-HCH transport system substrate-binding protein